MRGEDGELRTSGVLPGPRHKLALIRDEESGGWAWPQAGAPSTHVIKPETGEYPEYVANEMFCMTLFRQAGLPVAEATVESIGGRRCLVSPRYDRLAGDQPGETQPPALRVVRARRWGCRPTRSPSTRRSWRANPPAGAKRAG